MNFKKLLFVPAVLLLFVSNPTHSSKFDQSWKKYPYSDPKSKIEFPKDEGAHPFVSALEWWYVVMHVVGETTGEKYSILVTHFSNRFRFFTVSNVSRRTHTSATTFGWLNAKMGSLDVKQYTKWGTDYMRSKKDESGELIPFTYEFQTHAENMHLDAEITAVKKPLMLGETGYVPVGKRGKSWYYSQTRMFATGKLTHDGITENFVGIGWQDHQWGPFLISPIEAGGIFESYEWFCLQLDDGTDFMISNIFNNKHELPEGAAYGGVAMVRADGSSVQISKKNFKRTRYWQDPKSGKYMSMGWELEVPEWDLKLKIEPEAVNQMVKFPFNGDFWEGSTRVTGTVEGRDVSGRGFGELMHQYRLPKIKVKKLKKAYVKGEPMKLKWKIKNPDDGLPLKYQVNLIKRGGKSVTLAKDLTQPRFKFTPNSVGNFKFEVEAYSVDRVISSEEKTKLFEVVEE